jgi:hypothetical protein
LQGPPEFTQIVMFGLEIYHLATLSETPRNIFLKCLADAFHSRACGKTQAAKKLELNRIFALFKKRS